MKLITKSLTIPCIAALFIITPFAASANGTCTHEAKSKWMQKKDISARLQTEGYQVKHIKVEGSCYEAYALDKAGKRHELVINPMTGKSVREEAGE
ncbi:MAG: PepSY domain-containing protein [Paralcaligenes sp.]